MTHHTPGPWHALTRENYTLGGDSIEVVLLNEEGLVSDSIAQVLIDTGDDTPEERKVWKQHEANARLIAAAPELLEAAKQALLTLEAVASSDGYDCSVGTVPQLRAAIAKAAGATAQTGATQEVAKDTKDTERLDWLYSTRGASINMHGATNLIRFEWEFTNPDFRAAIDEQRIAIAKREGRA